MTHIFVNSNLFWYEIKNVYENVSFENYQKEKLINDKHFNFTFKFKHSKQSIFLKFKR